MPFTIDGLSTDDTASNTGIISGFVTRVKNFFSHVWWICIISLKCFCHSGQNALKDILNTIVLFSTFVTYLREVIADGRCSPKKTKHLEKKFKLRYKKKRKPRKYAKFREERFAPHLWSAMVSFEWNWACHILCWSDVVNRKV